MLRVAGSISYQTSGRLLNGYEIIGAMTDSDYDLIDELFTKLRMQLLKMRNTDPEVVEEMKSTVSQLDDAVESLYLQLKRENLKNSPKTSKTPRKRSK
jgi:hypothetical protein